MTDRRSFLARCLGLAAAPLLPLKAKADMIPAGTRIFGTWNSAKRRYIWASPGIYGEFFTISPEALRLHRMFPGPHVAPTIEPDLDPWVTTSDA